MNNNQIGYTIAYISSCTRKYACKFSVDNQATYLPRLFSLWAVFSS